MTVDISEIQQAKAWLYTALHNNADIVAAVGSRIYDSFPPVPAASRTYPYIVYNLQDDHSVNGLGHNRIQAQPKFQIRVVTDIYPIPTVVRTICKRIDDIFQNASNVLSGDYYFSSIQDKEIDRNEFDAATGRHYRNLGGIYNLYISKVP